MGRFANAFGPHAAAATYIDHSVPEHLYDTGEVHLNYVTVGDASHPALFPEFSPPPPSPGRDLSTAPGQPARFCRSAHLACGHDELDQYGQP